MAHLTVWRAFSYVNYYKSVSIIYLFIVYSYIHHMFATDLYHYICKSSIGIICHICKLCTGGYV